MTAVIEAKGLTRRYGAKEAVSHLALQVPAGSIYALLGPNGAGKSTTIKMLMNVLAPTSGSATVLGRAASRLEPQDFQRIGYVSETLELPSWMTVGQMLDYYRPLYPAWDERLCARLLDQFELRSAQRIRDLSRGTRMKAALLSSLAYRPELLVLDEPFSGLDPLVRDELIRGILELTEQERWTVFVSSQDIDEVERLADWVGVINAGRLYLSEAVASLQARFRQIELVTTSAAIAPADQPPSWLDVERAGHTVRLVDAEFRPGESEAKARAVFGDCRELTIQPLSLREIFLVLARTFRLESRRSLRGATS